MSWETLRSDLASALVEHSRVVVRLAWFVKIIFIAGGALLAAIALGIDVAHANREISSWTILGFVGAGLVALGTIIDAIREHDGSRALVTASQALDEIHQRERELNELLGDGEYDKAVNRGLHLYNSMDVMRGAIEQSLDLPDVAATTIIQTCLSVATNSLLGAFDFAITDIWTVCVYMAQSEGESDRVVLRCVAHLRKIPCSLSEARAWPAGVGVAGISYSMNKEIVIKDMKSPDAMQMFNLRTLKRDYDDVRYASMIAVPITIGTNPKPWGVAVATSDQPDHFSPEGSSYGVATTEPTRAIAAMSALAAKAAAAAGRRTQDVAPAAGSA